MDIIGFHKRVTVHMTVHVTINKGFCSIWCGEVGEYLLLKLGGGSHSYIRLEGHSVTISKRFVTISQLDHHHAAGEFYE